MSRSQSAGRQVVRGCWLLATASLALVLGGVGSRAGDQDRGEREPRPISDQLQDESDLALKPETIRAGERGRKVAGRSGQAPARELPILHPRRPKEFILI